jgi:hypothetical protein
MLPSHLAIVSTHSFEFEQEKQTPGSTPEIMLSEQYNALENVL